MAAETCDSGGISYPYDRQTIVDDCPKERACGAAGAFVFWGNMADNALQYFFRQTEKVIQVVGHARI